MGILSYDDSKLRKQVEELQKELTQRDELSKKRTIKIFVVGLIVGVIGTTASIVGALLALKII